MSLEMETAVRTDDSTAKQQIKEQIVALTIEGWRLRAMHGKNSSQVSAHRRLFYEPYEVLKGGSPGAAWVTPEVRDEFAPAFDRATAAAEALANLERAKEEWWGAYSAGDGDAVAVAEALAQRARSDLALLAPDARDLWDPTYDASQVVWKIDSERADRLAHFLQDYARRWQAILDGDSSLVAEADRLLAAHLTEGFSSNSPAARQVADPYRARMEAAYRAALEQQRLNPATATQERIGWWRSRIPEWTGEWDQTQARPIPQSAPQAPAGGDYRPTDEQVSFMQAVWGMAESGYGVQTRAKVAAIQGQLGITPDAGVTIGPRTWAAVLNTWQALRDGTEAVLGWQYGVGRALVALPQVTLQLHSPVERPAAGPAWVLGDRFGPRPGIGKGFHSGVDLSGPAERSVYDLAPAGGTVEIHADGNNNDWGNHVIIRTGQGVDFLVAHLAKEPTMDPGLIEGGAVPAGGRVGLLGRTGLTYNGAGVLRGVGAEHLHFEVWVHGAEGERVAIDPEYFFAKQGAALLP